MKMLYIQPTTPGKNITGSIYLGIGLLGYIMVRLYPEWLQQLPPCLFYELSGIPCPACGATRSAVALAHLNLWQAFLFNPFFFVIYLGILIWGLNSLAGILLHKNISLSWSRKTGKILRRVLIIAFPLNWLFLIVMNYFAGRNG